MAPNECLKLSKKLVKEKIYAWKINNTTKYVKYELRENTTKNPNNILNASLYMHILEIWLSKCKESMQYGISIYNISIEIE